MPVYLPAVIHYKRFLPSLCTTMPALHYLIKQRKPDSRAEKQNIFYLACYPDLGEICFS